MSIIICWLDHEEYIIDHALRHQLLQSIRPRGTRQRLERHDAFVIVTRTGTSSTSSRRKNGNVDFQQLCGARKEMWMLGETTGPLNQGNTYDKRKGIVLELCTDCTRMCR